MKRHVLVDGRNLLWRCSYVFRDLTSHGKSSGALYGFLVTLVRVHTRYGGRVWIAWEGKGENFRKHLYDGYKANRSSPELLAVTQAVHAQERQVQEFLAACGCRQYSGVRCEADDVIATLLHRKCRHGEALIYSNDADLRQLVSERVSVIAGSSKEDVIYDSARVVAKHGVKPRQIPDLKALMGDASDCYPGVKGIGPKTAAKLVVELGTAKAAVKAARRGQPLPVTERFRGLLAKSVGDVALFRTLSETRSDVTLLMMQRRPSVEKVRSLLSYWRMRSLEPRYRDLMKLGD
jgi:DNA polymerase-1